MNQLFIQMVVEYTKPIRTLMGRNMILWSNQLFVEDTTGIEWKCAFHLTWSIRHPPLFLVNMDYEIEIVQWGIHLLYQLQDIFIFSKLYPVDKMANAVIGRRKIDSYVLFFTTSHRITLIDLTSAGSGDHIVL